jgi:hypothetical protein
MNKPLPSDFPDMDLEAWQRALPMPNPYPADVVARKPAVSKPEPPLVLGSEVFVGRPPRFRRKP